MRAGRAGRSARPWLLAFGALGAAVVARNLLALDSAPPGMYVDEASIGYNAWAIAHFGVDEHGYHLPLYFQAFGESKNPLYIYALVPLVRFLALTPSVERVPAAVLGSVALMFMTMAAWRLTRSYAVALFMLVLAAFTPWLTQESRVGFEVIGIVATLSVALWCLADESRLSGRRFATAGVFLALSIFAYSTGRLEVALFAVVFALVYRRRHRLWWLTLVPIAAGYLVLGVWALVHPGALTAEFSVINIGADGASLPTLAARFITNYAQYFSPDFLFIHGDPNLRHNTGYSGMLLAVSAPLLLLGLWACWRRRSDALPRFLLLCLILAPIAASLTNTGGTGHALRGAVMLPFLMLLAAYGVQAVFQLATNHVRLVAGLLLAALMVQGALYTVDMYTAYPVRAAVAFDTGALPAMRAAKAAAGEHMVYVSDTLNEQPYIDAFMALLPPPPEMPTADAAGRGLHLLRFAVVDPVIAQQSAKTGDVIVVAASDPLQTSALQLIDEERAPTDPLHPAQPPRPLVRVYRVT